MAMNKGFCTITPTRGDRPELLAFCKEQLARMNVKPDHSYFIDYRPEHNGQDLAERVRYGITQAAADGFDYAFIIEDDDYYDGDYFNVFEDWKRSGAAIIGQASTIYYHLAKQGYTEMIHENRASLFTTGVRTHSFLHQFDWDKAKRDVFLDIAMWEYARRRKLPMFLYTVGTAMTAPNAIGIKHGLGLCGGKGHVMTPKVNDFDRKWLQSNVDGTAFDFYFSLMRANQWFDNNPATQWK